MADPASAPPGEPDKDTVPAVASSEPVTPEPLLCWLTPGPEPGLIAGNISGGTPPYTCTASTTSPGWIVAGCETSGSSFLVTYQVILPTGCGSPFDVTVIVTDADGSEASCSEYLFPPTGDCIVSPPFQEVCSGRPARFCAEAFLTPPVTYYWTGPDGFEAEGQCIDVDEEGDYTVIGIGAFGCQSVPCTASLFFKRCDEGCDPEFWARHAGLWDGVDSDDVTTWVRTTYRFNEFFAVSHVESKLPDEATLRDAAGLDGGGWQALARHAAVAAVNADAGINYSLTLEEVFEIYWQAVVGKTNGANARSALSILSAANGLDCPFK
jgi:hypothetical protein